MRTTIVIDKELTKKVEPLALHKQLSSFVNMCLYEHFDKVEIIKKQHALEKEYAQAARADNNEDFIQIETEDWPEW